MGEIKHINISLTKENHKLASEVKEKLGFNSWEEYFIELSKKFNEDTESEQLSAE